MQLLWLQNHDKSKNQRIFVLPHKTNQQQIHHIQFLTDDIEKTKKAMSAEGFNVLMEGQSSDGSFAFFDTTGPLKITWEALQQR